MIIVERKIKKKRCLIINQNLRDALAHFKAELGEQGKFNPHEYQFRNRRGEKFTIQHLNAILRDTFTQYRIRVQNSSSHTLRKTFGNRVWEMDRKSERRLVYLS
ncbi:site-specific integrase [Rufibacter roseus]|uniref:hypothetical protein n=1 Tax=Rufibacter roseus TaxID=1567108 RepID=UPI00374279E8